MQKLYANLEQREARFRSLIEHSSDFIVVLDRACNIVYVSPSSERVLKVNTHDLIEKHITALICADDHNCLPLKRGRTSHAYVVEDGDGELAGVLVRLEHERRYGADQHRFGNPGDTMASQIPRDFAATGRVSDHDRILQMEGLEQFCQIVRSRVHLVTVPRLSGPAVAAPVMRDDALATPTKEQHLDVPFVAT